MYLAIDYREKNKKKETEKEIQKEGRKEDREAYKGDNETLEKGWCKKTKNKFK